MNSKLQNNKQDQHPADFADKLQQLPVEEAVEILRDLPREKASAVLAELDRQNASEILTEFSTDEISRMLIGLPHDDAADLIAGLPEEQHQQVLNQLLPAESVKVSKLLHYPQDSAGGIMTDRFIALPSDATIKQSRETLRSKEDKEYKGTSYLYVVDSNQKLIGIISMRDLVFRMPDRKICEVMDRNVKAVSVNDDQEKVAKLFAQYHYMALPVIETDGRLMGIVEANSVIDVIQEEVTEDMELMVGVSGEETAYTPWRKAVPKRLPWLYVNLITACLSASVIALFENTIARWTALAIFFPIIAGQGGSTGMQTLTVIIRSIALGEISFKDSRNALNKEILVGLVNGLAVGIVAGIIGFIWKGSIILGVIASIAMFLNMLAAVFAGVVIPFGLKIMKIDPALASSILLTTVTEIGGFGIFLGLGTLVLKLSGI